MPVNGETSLAEGFTRLALLNTAPELLLVSEQLIHANIVGMMFHVTEASKQYRTSLQTRGSDHPTKGRVAGNRRQKVIMIMRENAFSSPTKALLWLD